MVGGVEAHDSHSSLTPAPLASAASPAPCPTPPHPTEHTHSHHTTPHHHCRPPTSPCTRITHDTRPPPCLDLQGYLEAKRDRMAHMLPEAVPEAELNGDFCFWDHDGEPTMPVVAAYAKGGMDLPAGLQQVEGGRVVPVAAPTPAAAAKQ